MIPDEEFKTVVITALIMIMQKLEINWEEVERMLPTKEKENTLKPQAKEALKEPRTPTKEHNL